MAQFAALTLAVTLAVASVVPATAAGLDAYLWNSRPVIVFAPSRDAPTAVDQIKCLAAAREALAERDMPVIIATKSGVIALSGGRAPAALKASELRRAYGVADGAFAIILIGKDGGEKLRSSEPVAVERLTGLVDGMPMRRREAR
jgi:hypothetical protein